MIVSAQFSLYPLRQEHLGPAIEAAGAALRAAGLNPETGPMSTRVVGDEATIFRALSEAFARAAGSGEVVMTITVSNACPLPG